MSATRAQVELVMRIGRQMFERGMGDLASELMMGFDGSVPAALEPSSDPNDGTLSAVERKRLRDKEYAAKRRLVVKKSSLVVSESSDESSATSSKVVSDSRAIAGVSESQKLRDSGVVSAESETSERVERSETRARESLESSEKSSLVVVESSATGRQSSSSATGDVSAEPPHALWRQIFDQWVYVAHHGKSIGKPSQFAQNFTDIARMAEQRCPADPVAFAKEVIVRYVADRRRRGKDLSPRFFAADFGTFADSAPAQPGAPPVDPVVREMRELNAKYADAQARGDAVATATYEQKLKLLGKRILANAS